MTQLANVRNNDRQDRQTAKLIVHFCRGNHLLAFCKVREGWDSKEDRTGDNRQETLETQAAYSWRMAWTFRPDQQPEAAAQRLKIPALPKPRFGPTLPLQLQQRSQHQPLRETYLEACRRVLRQGQLVLCTDDLVHDSGWGHTRVGPAADV